MARFDVRSPYDFGDLQAIARNVIGAQARL
jgi:hypothetical protein